MLEEKLPLDLPRISFKNVSRSFADINVLNNISFDLKRGERYALLGPNGAGKSTIMKLIAGHLRPDQGEIFAGGLCPWKNAKARLKIGFLAEGAPLAGELTVEEHLALAAALRGFEAKKAAKEKEKLCSALNLGPFLKRQAAFLSHGQARRAALAAAVLGEPDFLLLDEPSSGLDPEETERLNLFIQKLPKQTTLLISSHILEEVAAWSQSAIIINKGRLLAEGRWDKIFPALNKGQALRTEYLKLIFKGVV